MKEKTTYLILLISLSIVASVYAQDGENEGNGVEISTSILTRYIWRGYDLSHKDPVLMTYVYYSPRALEGVTFSTGAILGLKNKREQGDDQTNFDEYDLTVSYEKQIIPEKMVLTASILYYRYISHWTKTYYDDTRDLEFNILAVYTVNKYLIPFVSYFRGLDKLIKGNYVEAGFSNEFALSGDLTLIPKWFAGYSSQYEFHTNPKFTYLAAEFPLGYTKGPFYTELSGILIKPLRNSLNGSKKIVFCAGLNATLSF